MTDMGKSLVVRTLSVFLAGVVLAGHLPTVAAGMLVCIGDGTAPDCCRDVESTHEPRAPEAERLLSGAGCECCITVDALPSIAGASSCKASLDVAAGPADFRNVVPRSSTRPSRTMSGAGGDARLSSLRSTVLLI